MKIKVQTRKLAAGCSKHCFEVVDKTDEISHHIYGKVKLTWFKETFSTASLLNLLDTLTKNKSYNHPYHILHEIW
ncbi:hypothetical protein WKI23_03170 [Streptococcus pneumoniae]|uniref:hypothetical protein n=1 Tax=Streptococcus pseudopneumoniae TaxID=257758 RepID=UPI0031226924